jgi:hypothetical protein
MIFNEEEIKDIFRTSRRQPCIREAIYDELDTSIEELTGEKEETPFPSLILLFSSMTATLRMQSSFRTYWTFSTDDNRICFA